MHPGVHGPGTEGGWLSTIALMEGMSLRERKKARLRARLIEVSQRLFREQGFHETTLEQICAEVEVAPQTLLRYFESKQHLALAPHLDTLEWYRSELASRPADEDVLTCWRRLVTSSASHDVDDLRRYHELLLNTPVLAAALSTINVEIEDLLAVELAKEAGTTPGDDLHSRLLAALLVGGHAAVFRDWLTAGARDPLVPRLLEVADVAEAAFATRTAPRRNGVGRRRRAR